MEMRLTKEEKITFEELKAFLENNEAHFRNNSDENRKEAHRKFERWFDLLEKVDEILSDVEAEEGEKGSIRVLI